MIETMQLSFRLQHVATTSWGGVLRAKQIHTRELMAGQWASQHASAIEQSFAGGTVLDNGCVSVLINPSGCFCFIDLQLVWGSNCFLRWQRPWDTTRRVSSKTAQKESCHLVLWRVVKPLAKRGQTLVCGNHQFECSPSLRQSLALYLLLLGGFSGSDFYWPGFEP